MNTRGRRCTVCQAPASPTGNSRTFGRYREYRCERVLIVAHQVTVTCFRYLFERLDEETILGIDRAADVPNCSVTSYEFDPTRGRHGKLVPKLVSFVAPLLEAGAPVTAEPDVQAAPKS